MYLHPISSYVYKITCLVTGQYYYGFRCKNIKLKRTPDEDFWIFYFSSSKQVKSLITQYNLSNFEAEILSQHIDADTAYWQEQQNIKDSWGDPLLMNKHFVDPITNTHMFRATTQSAKKGYQTALHKGTLNINSVAAVEKRIGTRFQTGSINNILSAMNSPKSILKRAESRSDSWLITSPSNQTSTITNLAKFCKANNLNTNGMRHVAKGRRSNYKGWYCSKIS